MAKTVQLGFSIMIALLIWLTSSVGRAYADGIIIVKTDDPNVSADGQCSFIEAIVNANDDAPTYTDCPPGNGADTIVLQANTVYTLTTADNDMEGPNGLPAIISTTVISGNGSVIARDTISGTPDFRIFYVAGEGNLTLNDLTIRNGKVSSSDGGGIYNLGGKVMVHDSIISSNTTEDGGGGIRSFGPLTITNSIISGNSAGYGGGIHNTDIDFLYYDGKVTISSSTISSNTAESSGGGILNSGDIKSGFGLVTVNNSTISGNIAGSSGGGVANYGALRVNNSTISGNTVNGDGGGIYNDFYGAVEVNNSTISGNTVNGDGGGIYTDGNNTTTLANTILAENIDNSMDTSYPDCSSSAHAFISRGYNLIQNTTGCPTDTTDITGQDPLLGPLADNGGDTRTHALLPGSVAINAGDPAFTMPPYFDQRGLGFPRIVSGRIDIGAFESMMRLYLPIVLLSIF